MNYLRLTSLLLLSAFRVYGQQGQTRQDTLILSLADVWLKAEANSLALHIRHKETAWQAEEVAGIKTERLPDLGLAGSVDKATNIPVYEHGLLETPTQHDVIHTLYRVGADLQWTLYNGSKLDLRIQEEEIKHKIALIQDHEETSNVHYAAADLYLGLQKAFLFRKLINEDIANQEKQLKEIKALHKNEVVLKSDMLRTELTLSKRKMLLIQVDNDILIITQKLNDMMGEPDDRPVLPTPVSDSLYNTAASCEECLKQAWEHAHAYQISVQKTAISEIHLRQIKGNEKPTVSLNGSFHYANPQIFLYPYNPYWYSLGLLGLKVSYPVSSLYQNGHRKEKARIALDKEELAHKDVEDKIRQQVKEGCLRYQEALQQIDIARADVTLAIENARIVHNAYFNHTLLITDLLDADLQVLQAKFQLGEAKIKSQNQYYRLQRSIGNL